MAAGAICRANLASADLSEQRGPAPTSPPSQGRNLRLSRGCRRDKAGGRVPRRAEVIQTSMPQSRMRCSLETGPARLFGVQSSRAIEAAGGRSKRAILETPLWGRRRWFENCSEGWFCEGKTRVQSSCGIDRIYPTHGRIMHMPCQRRQYGVPPGSHIAIINPPSHFTH